MAEGALISLKKKHMQQTEIILITQLKHNQGQCRVHLGPKSNISEVVTPGCILGNCGNCPFTSKIEVQILQTIHIGNV